MLTRRLKYNLIKFLRLKGAPGKIALGFAVGACINFFPTFGIGVPLAAVASAMVFGSIPAGILGDVVFKPLFPVFFYLNILTGGLFWPEESDAINTISETVLNPDLSGLGVVGKVFFAGALINSLILGVTLYFAAYLIMERYRLSILKWVMQRNRRQN